MGIRYLYLFWGITSVHELSRRPRPSQAQPHPFRRPGTAQCRDKLFPVIAPNQRIPHVLTAILTGPPIAHDAGSDGLQLAIDSSNSGFRLLPPLQILPSADRCRKVGALLISPRRSQLIFNRICQPLERAGIVAMVFRDENIDSFGTGNHGWKRKRDRGRANGDILQHLAKLLLRGNAHRRLEQRLWIRDFTPVNAQVRCLMRTNWLVGDASEPGDRLGMIRCDAVEKTGQLSA